MGIWARVPGWPCSERGSIHDKHHDKFLIESMTRHGSFHSTLIDTSKSTVGRRMFFLSYIIPSLLQRLLQTTIDPDITHQLQPSFSILQHPTVSVHTNNMKTEAQTQLYCEGRRHCIGCAKRVETLVQFEMPSLLGEASRGFSRYFLQACLLFSHTRPFKKA